VAVAAIGIIASTSFASQTEVTLAEGNRTPFAGYLLRFEGSRVIRQPQRIVEVANVSVWRGERSLGRVTPSLNFYPSASEPIGTPSIKYGAFRDLYSSVLGFGAGGREATLRFFLNPGVMWLWVGGGIMALGGLLAAWPSRRKRVSRARPRQRSRRLAEVW